MLNGEADRRESCSLLELSHPNTQQLQFEHEQTQTNRCMSQCITFLPLDIRIGHFCGAVKAKTCKLALTDTLVLTLTTDLHINGRSLYILQIGGWWWWNWENDLHHVKRRGIVGGQFPDPT